MGLRLVSGIVAAMMGMAFVGTAQAVEPAKPAAKPPAATSAPVVLKRGDPATPECGWIGKRIIQLLSRDDVVAAGQFRQFYVGFGCSEAHLGAAFGCAVDGASIGSADACTARAECIDLCWESPTASTLDKAPRPAAPALKGANPAPAAAAPAAKPAPAAQPQEQQPQPQQQQQPQQSPPQPPKKPAPVPSPRGPYDAKP